MRVAHKHSHGVFGMQLKLKLSLWKSMRMDGIVIY